MYILSFTQYKNKVSFLYMEKNQHSPTRVHICILQCMTEIIKINGIWCRHSSVLMDFYQTFSTQTKRKKNVDVMTASIASTDLIWQAVYSDAYNMLEKRSSKRQSEFIRRCNTDQCDKHHLPADPKGETTWDLERQIQCCAVAEHTSAPVTSESSSRVSLKVHSSYLVCSESHFSKTLHSSQPKRCNAVETALFRLLQPAALSSLAK